MYPFSNGDTFGTFGNLTESITSEIRALDNEYVLKASLAELEKYFIEKISIAPLKLYADQRYIKNQVGIDLDARNDPFRFSFPGQSAVIRGTRVDIAIPFEGDPMLWQIRPSTYGIGGYPDIQINTNEIVFSVSFPDDSVNAVNAEQLRQDIERHISSLENAVANLGRDVKTHNGSASIAVSQALQAKVQLARSTVGVVSALGIPIKRAGTSPTFTLPTTRRARPTALPSVEKTGFEPEPVLDEAEYKHILEVLRSMSLLIERNPTSFSHLDEEAIRDHFLLQLNGHYEGGATGETFNASGKTDILIRDGNKNVFIAECKFWHGQKAFKEAIAQLLGYLTWRDSKCALLVFNKTKDSSAVKLKMHEAMELLTEYRKTVFHDPNGDSRYTLVKESEPGKEIFVTTQLYDIPTEHA